MNINQIIEEHALWLATNGKEGSCANFIEANLIGVDFIGVNLTNVRFTRVNLVGANFTNTNLTGAHFNGANLTNVNLTDANLTNANFTGANLTNANLTNANLTGVDFTGASLIWAIMEGANLKDANMGDTCGNLTRLKSIFCDTYHVTYADEVMQIGCQRHKFEAWWNFDDGSIISMGGRKALEWWRIWKPILQQIIAASSATGHLSQSNKKVIP